MKDIELSLRMKTVADMVKKGSSVADIGCDHAFVPIYLVANGITDRVIASDVRTGPCAIARENIAKWGLTDKVELRLGDGLNTIKPGEADTIIIAGMGGMLITDILDAGMDVVKSADRLILQPQSEIEHVRRYIYGQGFAIDSEQMLVDAGKYYVVMSVDVSPDNGNNIDMKEIYYKYGHSLLNEHSSILKAYLEERRLVNNNILQGLKTAGTENAKVRMQKIEHELSVIEEALASYY